MVVVYEQYQNMSNVSGACNGGHTPLFGPKRLTVTVFRGCTLALVYLWVCYFWYSLIFVWSISA